MNEEGWARIAESGTMGAMRFGAWFHRTFGRRASHLLLLAAASYYAARHGDARRASRAYRERLRALPEGRAALARSSGGPWVVRHLYEFALCLYDRMLAWGGALDDMEVAHDGSGAAFDIARSRSGALLLGAHLGSIDLLGLIARKHELPVNVVTFYGNAARINAFLESFAPESRVRTIELDPGSVTAAFEIRACVERGELVVILADRVAPGKTARTARVPFLGARARFPLGPFLLARVLGCPTFFALCVREGDGRYRTLLRPLAPAERVPPGEREKRAGELAERYAAMLEHYCLLYPLQWFNFYDFFRDDAPAEPGPRAATAEPTP